MPKYLILIVFGIAIPFIKRVKPGEALPSFKFDGPFFLVSEVLGLYKDLDVNTFIWVKTHTPSDNPIIQICYISLQLLWPTLSDIHA